MVNLCSKLVKWDDGVGRTILDGPNHFILQMWAIQSGINENGFKNP